MKEGVSFREKRFYRVLNAGLLVCAVLPGAGSFLGVGHMGWPHALTAVVVFGMLAGMYFCSARGRILCLGAALVCVCTGIWTAGLRETLRFIGFYIPWLLGTRDFPQEWVSGYGLLHTAVIVAACYGLGMLMEVFPAVKLVFGGMLLAGMAACLPLGIELPRLGVVFGICYVVMICTEQVQRRWKKMRSKNGKVQMLWILPFFAWYILLMACMPAPKEPYDWLWAKNIYRQAREAFLVFTENIRWGGGEAFGMAFSGFSESAALGGGVKEDADEVMVLALQRGSLRNVYLTGSVYDTFDGRQWRQRYRNDSQDVLLDTAETVCGVRRYHDLYGTDYLKEARIRIQYRHFHTKYVFSPLKTWNVDEIGGNTGYFCEGENLRWRRYQGYGAEYEVRYFQMNTGQETFYRFLEAAAGGYREAAGPEEGETGQAGFPGEAGEPGPGMLTDEEIWKEVRKEYGGEAGSGLTLENLEEHRSKIYENYLGDITLSEAAEEYLAKITGDAGTDVEKLRAIEKELSSYTYTATPGELPGRVGDEGEFLDFFMLESRKGYCTYFATAFVLLARKEGIPARYVQGFCVPVTDGGETFVYSNMAHAWPEAYIAGAGWIPFEPTPGYGGIRYVPWKLQQPGPDGPGENGEVQEETLFAETQEDIRESEETERRQEDREQKESSWNRLFWIIPGILAVCVLVSALDYVWRKYRYGKMDPEGKFRAEVYQNLYLLTLLGLKRQEGETLEELRGRGMGMEWTKEGDVPAPFGFLEEYERILYGGKTVREDMIRRAAGERLVILARLKKEKRHLYFYGRMKTGFMGYR